jgi:glycerophosphoryl diester phosphodiesterase
MITVIGHKGAAGLEPENTMRAFKKALELNVDFIEFDVRMTKDKKLIIMHDPKVDRTTNGKGYVKDLTLEEIKKLDAGEGEKVPIFEEVINLLKDRKPKITIDIKEPQTLDKIMKIIRENKLENKVVIVSFWHEILKRIKEIEPSIKTSVDIVEKPINLVSMVKDAKADKISLHSIFIDEKTVKECHENDIEITAWTVDEFLEIDRMIKLGVDTICSNFPDRVISRLEITSK